MSKKSEKKSEELGPNQIVRMSEGRKYFGYKSSHLAEKIAAGEIPAPISLSDSGRAKGWLGRQIIEWQAQRLAASRRNEAAA